MIIQIFILTLHNQKVRKSDIATIEKMDASYSNDHRCCFLSVRSNNFFFNSVPNIHHAFSYILQTIFTQYEFITFACMVIRDTSHRKSPHICLIIFVRSFSSRRNLYMRILSHRYRSRCYNWNVGRRYCLSGNLQSFE